MHGWGDLQGELNAMSKRGQWKEMGEVISDDVLRAFAVESENAKGVAQGIVGRFGDLVDRTTWAYYQPSPDRERELIEAFGAARGARGRGEVGEHVRVGSSCRSGRGGGRLRPYTPRTPSQPADAACMQNAFSLLPSRSRK